MSSEDININTVRLKSLPKHQQNVVIYSYLYNLARSVSVVISMNNEGNNILYSLIFVLIDKVVTSNAHLKTQCLI